jgi:hypothetical protein
MFLRPQEFRPGSFEIKGNKIHFKNVPYTGTCQNFCVRGRFS